MRCVPVPQQELGETFIERSGVSVAGLHGLLERLDEALGESVGRWVVWCASDVANAVGFGELGELIGGELWTVVADDLLRDAMSCEDVAEFADGRCRRG